MTNSVYEYTTTAALEAYAILDYSAIDAKYTDVVIEANISQAERIINAKCDRENDAFTAPIPDGVVAATLEIAKRLMHNNMFEDGYATEKTRIFDPFVDQLIEAIIGPDKNTKDFGIIRNVTSNYWSD